MSDTEPTGPSRTETRAELLDEEAAAGSDDQQAQAEAILAESDARVDDPEGTRADSSQTPDRPNGPAGSGIG
jgi:hypothetical protein